MNSTDVVRRLGAVVVLALGSVLIGGNGAPAEPVLEAAATFTLKIFFDGGYSVDFDQNTSVDVHAINAAKYPMLANIMTDSSPTTVKLTGYDVSLWPDGNAPSPLKPGIPPLDTEQTGCKYKDIALPNNRLFIPSFEEIAKVMKTDVEIKPKTTLHLTGGGVMSVDSVGGCVEFRDSAHKTKSKPISKKHSMVAGVAGLLYEWRNVPGTRLVLKRKPLTGGDTKSTDIVPNANGLIVLWMSHQDISVLPARSESPVIRSEEFEILLAKEPPYPIDFEDHFKDAFKKYDKAKFALWWLGPYKTSPGIDCPTGYP